MSILLTGGGLWLLALLVIAAGGLLILARPDAATLIALLLIYSNTAVVAVKFHGVPWAAAAVGTVDVCVAVVPSGGIRPAEVLDRTHRLGPCLALLVIQLMGVAIARQPELALDKMKDYLLECLVLFLLITNVVRTKEMLRRAVWTLLIAGSLMGALGGLQFVTGTQHRDYGGFAQVPRFDPTADIKEDLPRYAGPVGEKNYFAQFMLMLLPLGVFRVVGERSRSLRVAAAIATALLAIGIALTYSRGAVVGFAVMSAVMIALGYVRLRHAVLVLVLVAGLGLLIPGYAGRLQSFGRVFTVMGGSQEVRHTDKATQGRLTEMAAAALVFLDHPMLGVGPGMFRHHFLDKATALGFQVHGTTRMAHCAYLEIAAEHGILGLAAFLLILILTLRRLAVVRATSPCAETANMATAFLLAVVVMMTTAVFLSPAYVRYYWLILGLAATLDTTARREHAASVSPSGSCSASN